MSGVFRLDRKLVGILSVFILAALILLGIVILSTDTMSALRSYSTMQAHWTEIRKEAVSRLETYVLTGEQRYMEAYRRESRKLQDLKGLRGELESDVPDHALVMKELGRLRFKDREIRGMIRVYRRFGDLPQLKAAIEVWTASDLQMSRLDELADSISSVVSPPGQETEDREKVLAAIDVIDGELTSLQYELAQNLEQGTSYLRSVVIYSALGTGVLLFLIGGYMARRYIESRERSRRRIESQLEEKTVLLEEIHHRVKNNLAFVSSLLLLHEDDINHIPARRKLKEAQDQIVSIADVHEIIYNTENFTDLPVQNYLEQIMDKLAESYSGISGEIEYSVDANNTRITLNEAIPFGLILNELATNSYKHAFDDGRAGRIAVKVRSDGQRVDAEYYDNGRGVPPGFRIEEAAKKSLGMKLVLTFLMQLEAEYELMPECEGFGLAFSFRIS